MDDNWISVKDKLPEIRERVLVYRKKGVTEDIQIFNWYPDDENIFTHWMPLPEPPK